MESVSDAADGRGGKGPSEMTIIVDPHTLTFIAHLCIRAMCMYVWQHR